MTTELGVEEARRALFAGISERRFQDEVIRHAKALGWLVQHSRKLGDADGRWRTPIQGDPGYPDLTLVKPACEGRRARLLFLELKTVAGRTSPAQRTWISALSGVLGIEVHVVSPMDWALIDRLLAS